MLLKMTINFCTTNTVEKNYVIVLYTNVNGVEGPNNLDPSQKQSRGEMM